MDAQNGALPGKPSKKEVRKAVYEKLSSALAEYKDLKAKKFKNNLKKASKLFAADITKALKNKKDSTPKKVKEKKVAVKIAQA